MGHRAALSSQPGPSEPRRRARPIQRPGQQTAHSPAVPAGRLGPPQVDSAAEFTSQFDLQGTNQPPGDQPPLARAMHNREKRRDPGADVAGLPATTAVWAGAPATTAVWTGLPAAATGATVACREMYTWGRDCALGYCPQTHIWPPRIHFTSLRGVGLQSPAFYAG